jgi:hypothetical protein
MRIMPKKLPVYPADHIVLHFLEDFLPKINRNLSIVGKYVFTLTI